MKMTHLSSCMHCIKSSWPFLWIKNIRVKWLSNTFQVINWKEAKTVSFCWRWSGGVRLTRMGHRKGRWLHVTTYCQLQTHPSLASFVTLNWTLWTFFLWNTGFFNRGHGSDTARLLCQGRHLPPFQVPASTVTISHRDPAAPCDV